MKTHRVTLILLQLFSLGLQGRSLRLSLRLMVSKIATLLLLLLLLLFRCPFPPSGVFSLRYHGTSGTENCVEFEGKNKEDIRSFSTNQPQAKGVGHNRSVSQNSGYDCPSMWPMSDTRPHWAFFSSTVAFFASITALRIALPRGVFPWAAVVVFRFRPRHFSL